MAETKYFAQLDGRQQGPFTLAQLMEAGVRPSTYVWCKGMDDWQQARTVADICRAFRQRLSGPRPDAEETQSVREEEDNSQMMSRFQGIEIPNTALQEEDTTQPPAVWFPLAVLATVLFAPMGIFALFYAIGARKYWKKAMDADSHDNQPQRQQLAHLSHEFARRGKMWAGITLFFILIVYPTILFLF